MPEEQTGGTSSRQAARPSPAAGRYTLEEEQDDEDDEHQEEEEEEEDKEVDEEEKDDGGGVDSEVRKPAAAKLKAEVKVQAGPKKRLLKHEGPTAAVKKQRTDSASSSTDVSAVLMCDICKRSSKDPADLLWWRSC
jgi:hypothetical protein